jgi:rhodanese-related sulfurtransferase
MASKTALPRSIIRTRATLFTQSATRVQFHTAQTVAGVAQGQSGSETRREARRLHSAVYERVRADVRGGLPARRETLSLTQRRAHSTAHQRSKVYEYDDVSPPTLSPTIPPIPQLFSTHLTPSNQVLAILETPSDSRLLIDVREPHEYEKNTIPTAINLPINSQPDALLLPEEEFLDKFGFQKPPTNKEIVLFCKAGVRSSAAAGIARQAGCVDILP